MMLKQKIFIIEDHNEALKIWEKIGVKYIDLVHIDAHIDFSFYSVKSTEEVIEEAKSLSDLKDGLERRIAFSRYKKDLDAQLNIGNYIYPAIKKGIVKDFYWVIPGRLKDFAASVKTMAATLKAIDIPVKKIVNSKSLKKGIISTRILGSRFIICQLDTLPVLKEKVLLDIDTDFLAIENLAKANNICGIGERTLWLLPQALVSMIKEKIIKQPHIITIAYSVNGGYTPIIYKHMADEMAYCFMPSLFKARYKKNWKAASYFALFYRTGKKQYYKKAVMINSSYRAQDNNYGPLYLILRKYSAAEREFKKILKVDPKNAASLSGLGNVALEKKDFKKANRYFKIALKNINHRLFAGQKAKILLGLAKASLGLHNFKEAEDNTLRYVKIEPLRAEGYYILGLLSEKKKDYRAATRLYLDALRLGGNSVGLLYKLSKSAIMSKEKDVLIKYIYSSAKTLKKRLAGIKGEGPKKERLVHNRLGVKNRLEAVERMLSDYFQAKR